MLEKIFINGSHLKRLDNIKQWQEVDVFNHESVSQHSYKVSVFASILLQDIFGDSSDPRVLDFKVRAINQSIFHDWDESIIKRDLSHEVKYNDYNGEKIRIVIDDYVSRQSKEEFGERSMIHNIISTPDADTKLLCKFCDWLALDFYMRREKDCGNNNLDDKIWRVRNGISCSALCLKDMLVNKFNSVSMDLSSIDYFIKYKNYE